MGKKWFGLKPTHCQICNRELHGTLQRRMFAADRANVVGAVLAALSLVLAVIGTHGLTLHDVLASFFK